MNWNPNPQGQPGAPLAPAGTVSYGVQPGVSVEERLASHNVSFEVIQYDRLTGSDSASVAQKLYYTQQTGLRLKQVRIRMQNGAVTLEAGSLNYLKGMIEVTNTAGGVTGAISKLIKSKLTGEGAFNPQYRGTGEVVLEPGFGHYMLIQLNNEELIVDKGLFVAAESSVEVGVFMQKNLSSALLGGEGLFQTALRGSGIVALASPVSPSEIVKYTLNNETLQVDGNFALLRKGAITFTVERSAKSIFGTLTSGEGVLQTFRGTGEVWIAPTQAMYERLKFEGVSGLSGPQASMASTTSRGKSGFFGKLLSFGD
jgi:uncharacterized protein (AIM24 family)